MTCLLLCYALSLRLPVLVGCHLLLISGSFQGNVQRQHAAARAAVVGSNGEVCVNLCVTFCALCNTMFVCK
jgi:hypothetical protein